MVGRQKVINPKTGRKVYRTGLIGKALKEAKKKKAKSSTPDKKIVKKQPTTPQKKVAKRKLHKKKGGPIKGKFYGYEGATKVASPLMKIAGKTKNNAVRPSARAYFDRGDYGPVCYGGKCHMMAFRSNGSPYWKAM